MVGHALALILALGVAAGSAAAAQPDELTIYRCTDAKGKLSLQDVPCPDGQAQQTRTVQRLQDPPPRPAPASPAPADPAPPPQVQVVVQRAPQPMYECVRPDNSRYTSDSNEGNPRYVSVYDLADGGLLPRGRWHGGEGRGAQGGFRPVDPPLVGLPYSLGEGSGTTPVSPPLVGIPQGSQHRGIPRPPRPPQRPGYGYGYGYGPASVRVRDQCHPLPPAEICARVRGERDDIRRRFFNAQQRERERLDKQERALNARLSADCGGY